MITSRCPTPFECFIAFSFAAYLFGCDLIAGPFVQHMLLAMLLEGMATVFFVYRAAQCFYIAVIEK